MPLEEKYRELTYRILGGAIEVHRNLGPGLLESTYRACLQHELTSQGLQAITEVPISVNYKGLAVESSYRADLIVEETVILELKAVEQLLPVHSMQTLTYMRLANLPIALLINFNVPCLKQGTRRFVNFRSGTVRSASALPS